MRDTNREFFTHQTVTPETPTIVEDVQSLKHTEVPKTEELNIDLYDTQRNLELADVRESLTIDDRIRHKFKEAMNTLRETGQLGVYDFSQFNKALDYIERQVGEAKDSDTKATIAVRGYVIQARAAIRDIESRFATEPSTVLTNTEREALAPLDEIVQDILRRASIEKANEELVNTLLNNKENKISSKLTSKVTQFLSGALKINRPRDAELSFACDPNTGRMVAVSEEGQTDTSKTWPVIKLKFRKSENSSGYELLSGDVSAVGNIPGGNVIEGTILRLRKLRSSSENKYDTGKLNNAP
ncbi:MAG TPA: hypothetical protein VEA59_06810 [Patescibacteria group bacterium]|nr:hypothetical protein [Patescibacteria group bacterium]